MGCPAHPDKAGGPQLRCRIAGDRLELTPESHTLSTASVRVPLFAAAEFPPPEAGDAPSVKFYLGNLTTYAPISTYNSPPESPSLSKRGGTGVSSEFLMPQKVTCHKQEKTPSPPPAGSSTLSAPLWGQDIKLSPSPGDCTGRREAQGEGAFFMSGSSLTSRTSHHFLSGRGTRQIQELPWNS